ncbi:MAG: phospholipid carrier-dependent glycosyltransferase [Candidatus Krumholzibacteriota bacterium]|nr:phospholipid carrier-dependent glycosyltransferase [Candidatus Krumholzibacteriota bacterium]
MTLKEPSERVERGGRRNLYTCLVLVAVAVIMRIWGIDWGLPQVYEEAVPLKKAWAMWGWDRPSGTDLNPHFFNYPSLTFYVHFIGLGLHYVVASASGVIESASDYVVLYITDKTSFYMVGRLLSTMFGVGTVWLTYLLARAVSGRIAATFAMALMAINTFHITRSQMIEVDVPLTFFVVLTMWLLLRPGRRDYIWRTFVRSLSIKILSFLR